jgi:hypothetical protein
MIRPILAAVALADVIALLSGLAQAQERYVPCTTWNKEVPLSTLMDTPSKKYSQPGGPGYYYYLQWVIGYASGAAGVGLRYNVPGADTLRVAADESGSIGITSWVTRYCAEHPSANLGDAAEDFVNAFLSR